MIIDEKRKIGKCENRFCYNFFTFKKGSTGKYCTRSCSAKENNTLVPKRKKNDPNLTFIGFSPSGRRRYTKPCPKTGCDTQIGSEANYCREHYEINRKTNRQWLIEDWLSGKWDGKTESGKMSNCIRPYLLEQADYKCTVCGFNERHPSDGSCILEIDHINGDSTDHRPENLKVLCPNHHALTPTYKARNMGKGRKDRYKKAA